jgi:hypothetical protein
MAPDGRRPITDGETTSSAVDGGVTHRRRKVEGRAEELRNRTLRKEAEAREEKEAMRRSDAAKSKSLRALRLARAATARASSGETAEAVAAPSRRAEGD